MSPFRGASGNYCQRREKTTIHHQRHASHSGRRKSYILHTAVTRDPTIDQRSMVHDPGSGGGCKPLAPDDLPQSAWNPSSDMTGVAEGERHAGGSGSKSALWGGK